MAEGERRSYKRIPFIQDVVIEGVGSRRCSDISVGGMYLETVSAFSEGETFKIRFSIPDGDARPIETEARVLYVHHNVGAGIVFLNMKPEDEERIKKFVGGG